MQAAVFAQPSDRISSVCRGPPAKLTVKSSDIDALSSLLTVCHGYLYTYDPRAPFISSVFYACSRAQRPLDNRFPMTITPFVPFDGRALWAKLFVLAKESLRGFTPIGSILRRIREETSSSIYRFARKCELKRKIEGVRSF